MKKTLDENDEIKDLGAQNKNSSLRMGRLNKDLYGIDFPEMIQTVKYIAKAE